VAWDERDERGLTEALEMAGIVADGLARRRLAVVWAAGLLEGASRNGEDAQSRAKRAASAGKA